MDFGENRLMDVYIKSIKDIKNIILNESAGIFKVIGSNYLILEEILSSDIPAGSEVFILRMLFKATDKTTKLPSDFIKLIKNVYQRTHDPRFLIPILRFISKSDLLEYLPYMIAIPAFTYVKKALLSILAAREPITPMELLINLHLLDLSKHKDGVSKQVHAVLECINSKVFGHDDLASVLQQLIDSPNVPKLFLRTVIETLTLYPRLIDFVVELLSQLVVKQVWKDKDLWRGFISCCIVCFSLILVICPFFFFPI